MKSKILKLIIIALAITSCSQIDEIVIKPEKPIDVNDVSIEDVTLIANTQAPWLKSKNGRVAKRSIVGQIVKLPKNNKEPIMYIVNYEDSGFIIIAADKRISPILAYSEDNNFPINQKALPGGLVSWMSSMSEGITSIRSKHLEQDETLKKLWKKYGEKDILNTTTSKSSRLNSTIYVGDCNNGDSGFTEVTEGAVTTPTWYQRDGYNDALDPIGCSGNGRPPTGCVATAVGEIMRFYSYPSWYNWSAMPTYYTNTGSPEISMLMKHLGYSHNLDMDYECDASGAYSSNVPRTFFNFGYSQAIHSSFNLWNAKGELSNGRPILIRGRESFWDDFFPEGHLWVAEGVRYWGYYACAPDPNTPGEWVAAFTGYDCSMRMNWGWGGTANGWFSANNYNPEGYDFNHGNDMIYNIRP